ncbi:DUF3158 family protein [Salmonella enterica subsp. enterica]|nr:DUF3158 family protein [Salmonella enterica subsp. enterica]EIY5764747.1 DUF3158 family protein [Salmonella enterica subsp. enterica]EIY5769107.1 DUF3158 family protein [Salmonella enterica subsp. enterica]
MNNDDDKESAARKSSLKGLLKAFKGKGELRALVQELRALRVQLQLRQPMLKQAVYELRDALMTLEWRRQVLNTQLSVVMFMLRRIQPLTTLV